MSDGTALASALRDIRDLTLDVPAAYGDPESYYLGQLRTAIGTAARALAGAQAHPPAPLPLDVDDPRSRCAICRRVVAVEFVAPADLWVAAAREFQYEHLCIACFDERVPADWPVFWETVTTLWPVSRGRATASAAPETTHP